LRTTVASSKDGSVVERESQDPELTPVEPRVD
jgi:hypothetical protein